MSTEVLDLINNVTPNEDGSITLTKASVAKLTKEATLGQERTDKFREEAKEYRQKNSGLTKQIGEMDYLKDDLEKAKKETEEVRTQLKSKDEKLTGFYNQRKEYAKKLGEKFNILKDEKYASIKDRFAGLDDLDNQTPEKVEELITNFGWLDFQKQEPKTNFPPVKDDVKPPEVTNKYGYKNT